MKILISDKSSPRCAELLREAGHEVDENTGLSPEELKSIIGDYHGLVIRSATKVTAEILDAATNLKVVGRAGTGVDNVDLDAATRNEVVVMNTPGGNSNAVAELALGHMLAISRHICSGTNSLREGKWEKKQLKGVEITGKTIGILGYGRISRILAEKCRLLGMTVLCYDPKIQKEITDSTSLKIVSSLDALLAVSDYISIHLTKRPDTVNLINEEKLAKMKSGAYLINCSRGGIVNEHDLAAALDKGWVAGAAVDVFDSEPPTDFTLIQHPKVICTPHIGASSVEAQDNVAIMVAEQFIDFFSGKEVRNAVN